MKRESGFTLVELLVVIAIIALLAGLMVPLTSKGAAGAKKKRAALEVNSLVVAVGQFHDDHHYMPSIDGKQLGDDAWVETSNKDWVEVMQGNNAMKKNYLGMKANDEGTLLDPWGNGYRVGMDRNLDGRVDAQDGNKVAMEKAVAASAGPDGQFGNEDDIETAEWR